VVGLPEVPAIVGTPLQLTPDVDPHEAAADTPGTMANDATARAEAAIKRLVHIMVPFFPQGDCLCVPLPDHDRSAWAAN